MVNAARRRLLGCGLLLCLLCPGTGGCADGDHPARATLLIARPGDALTLDPAAITDLESMQVATQIFETLVRYRERSTEVEPGLATHWEERDGGTTWRFFLRRDVTFHDGTPFDADAVVFSFERQRDPLHPQHFQSFPYWENTFRNILGTRRLDRYTVELRIRQSYAPFLANLAMFPVSVVSPTAMRRAGAAFARAPVGTGPYRFGRWQRGDRIELARNPRYWGSPPAVEKLVYRVVPDARQALAGLQSGTLDVAHSLAPEDRQIVLLHSDLRLYRSTGNNVAYLAMNTQKAPFDDPRVRQAVNYAVNKRAIVKLVYQGLAVPARGPLPPGLWGHNAVARAYPYDPERARLLLRAVGWEPSRRLKLYTMDTPRPYMPSPLLAARIISRNLVDVGLKVDLVVQPYSDHVRALRNGEHDLCLMGWLGDNGDPDNFLYVLLDRDNARRGTAQNLAFYANDTVHDLLVKAQSERRRGVRQRYYEKVQELVAEDAPWVPLAHSDVVVAARRAVQNLLVHPTYAVLYGKVRF